MSKDKDNNVNEQEPWDQPIYEDEYEDGSRKSRRGSSGGRNWFIVILIILLFLIVLVPTVAILYSKMDNNKNAGNKIEVSSSLVESSTTKESETKSSESTKESTTESSTESSTTSSSTTDSSSSSSSSSSFEDVEVPKNDPQAEAETPAQPQTGGGDSVVYGQGDNISIWRIAQNNGVSEEQIYQLNPGIDPYNLQDGQSIRIR